MTTDPPTDTQVSTWCSTHLGSSADRIVPLKAHLSAVFLAHLRDGWRVVLKVRAAAPRLDACVEVQRRLNLRGFPCPAPIAGPSSIGALAVTAEEYVGGGHALLADHPRCQQLYAAGLARLIDQAPRLEEVGSLSPPPPWAAWDHDDGPIWPIPDDLDLDLNADPGPRWLDDAAARVRRRLARYRRREVVGYVDWEEQNLRWEGDELLVVHDWDSVAARPEPAIAGIAAAVVPGRHGPGRPDLDESARFLEAYTQARLGPPWTGDDREAAWAAGLWVRAFNAKKASVRGDEVGLGLLASLVRDWLALAGA